MADSVNSYVSMAIGSSPAETSARGSMRANPGGPTDVPAPHNVPRPQTLLEILLRIGGCAMVLAFPMALLPTATMASVHEALGLGAYPQPSAPLLEYLTRSISLLYGFHGALLLMISTDVVRFSPIVRYLGWMNILFGIGVLAIDLAVGLPAFWTWGEGPPVVATGIAILFLVRRINS